MIPPWIACDMSVVLPIMLGPRKLGFSRASRSKLMSDSESTDSPKPPQSMKTTTSKPYTLSLQPNTLDAYRINPELLKPKHYQNLTTLKGASCINLKAPMPCPQISALQMRSFFLYFFLGGGYGFGRGLVMEECNRQWKLPFAVDRQGLLQGSIQRLHLAYICKVFLKFFSASRITSIFVLTCLNQPAYRRGYTLYRAL